MQLKRVNLFASLFVSLSCSSCHGLSLFTMLRTRVQTPGSAKRNSHTSQLGLVSCPASSGRLARLVARRANQGAGHAAGATAPALSARVQSQACVSLVVRGVGRRSSERHRRAADKRLLLPVIWLVASARVHTGRQRVRVTHIARSQRVSRCAQERSGSPLDDTLSQRELPHSRGTLAHYSLLHLYVPSRSSFLSVSFFSTTIEDVSHSQI
jgi:hypothetical protein